MNKTTSVASQAERPEVVQAIVAAFTADTPNRLPGLATTQERWSAEPLIRTRLDAHADLRRSQAILTLFDAYRGGDDWHRVFDRLSPRDLLLLRGLRSMLPPLAAQVYDQRFIWFT